MSTGVVEFQNKVEAHCRAQPHVVASDLRVPAPYGAAVDVGTDPRALAVLGVASGKVELLEDGKDMGS